MKARFTTFGVIEIASRRYDHDVVIDGGQIRKRIKKVSKVHRAAFGHIPLSLEENLRGGDASRPGGLGLHLGGGGAAPGPPERRDHPRPSRGDQGRAGHRPGDISGPDPHIIRCRIDTEDFHRPGDISGLDSHGQSDDPRPRAGRFRLRAGADGRRHPPRPCLRCVLPRHRSRSADRILGRRVLRR